MSRLSRDGRVVSHQGVGEQPSLVRDTVVMVLVTNKTEVWPHTVERCLRQEELPILWWKQDHLVRENLKYI